MLIDKVKVFRLISGEEIICELVGVSNDGKYIVSNPVVLHVMPDPNNPNRIGVQLAPFTMFSSSTEVKLNPSLIFVEATPVKELFDQYNAQFGTGIVVPTMNKIPELGRPVLVK